MNKSNKMAKFPISFTLEIIVRSSDCKDFQFLAILNTRNSRRERKMEKELDPAFELGSAKMTINSTKDITPIIPSKHRKLSL